MKKQPFAVFDIDGTLIRWQLYHAVVDKLAKEGALGVNARDKLHEARMVWKRRVEPDAFKSYEKTLIEVYESALNTLSASLFDDMVHSVIDEYKEQTYTYTRDLARALKSEGYVLLAISGSHQELVEQLAKHYEFDDWSGTRYERLGAGFSGQKFVASSDKKKGLQEMVAKHDLTYENSIAIGDSLSDAPMLELVERPIAFNPDRALFEIARKQSWKIVIERKNMIYELEKKNGGYSLK